MLFLVFAGSEVGCSVLNVLVSCSNIKSLKNVRPSVKEKRIQHVGEWSSRGVGIVILRILDIPRSNCEAEISGEGITLCHHH